MDSSNVLNCMFESWYQKFKNVTFASESIALPGDFITYLLADGVVLPIRSNSENQSNTRPHSDNESEEDWEDDGEVADAPSFPELDISIKEAIERLGGCVLPKLNWSCPQDAGWMMLNQSLKCTEPDDVYLLLKSSDFIMHDLTQPFKNCRDREASDTSGVEYKLVLRAWHEINVGMEFRCFVKDNKLIGISQRHHTNYFDYLQDQAKKITRQITNFYEKKIHSKFGDSSYVFDVYIDGNCVYLIDFNSFGQTTDPLMFSWEQLLAEQHTVQVVEPGEEQQEEEQAEGAGQEEEEEESQWPEFRYNKNSMVQGHVYRRYTMPQDFIDLAQGNDPAKLYDLLHLKIQSENGADTSDEEGT